MMSPDNIDERDELLAAEYALGVMPLVQRLSFEARLADDKYLQERVAWWCEKLTPINDKTAPLEVPAKVYKNIVAELFGEPQQKSGWWNNIGLWRGLAALSIACLLALTTLYGTGTLTTKTPAKNVYVAEIEGKDTNLKLIALYDSETKTLKMNRLQGAVNEGRDFELWLIPDKQKPISLGILSRNSVSNIKISEALHKEIISTSLFAISDEPLGGSPTGQATGPVVALGKIISM